MKRYLLFAWSNPYENGGWGDFSADFESLPEVFAYIQNGIVEGEHEYWYQLVDRDLASEIWTLDLQDVDTETEGLAERILQEELQKLLAQQTTPA